MMDERLKTLKCDVCGNQATKWYGFTSATLCENPECFKTTDLAFKNYEAEQLNIETPHGF
jgi:hypothetical protein